MRVLEELEQAVRQVAERVGPSVVGIGRGRGRGSGVVLADGLVATNAHNIRGEETTVVFGGDRSAVGRVAGVDVDADLAVIAVDTGGAPAIAWATDADAQVGAAVFALANPGGQLRVTFGLVSAIGRAFRGPRGRRIAGSIEHTAPLPRGASGGPVVDTEGRLLGIDTNRLGDGFYLALPADAELRQRLEARSLQFDETLKRVNIRVSGCNNSCGQHHVSDIGFYGSSRNIGAYKVPHFLLVLGGELADNAGNYGLA
ncbi:MAG TPA: trypsin-like peptidase domain-containing protein, partial [Actinomycetes bacterium]|nr:trypsin-like peptidase domain-containing protein [Actinomycetes bacterium]